MDYKKLIFDEFDYKVLNKDTGEVLYEGENISVNFDTTEHLIPPIIFNGQTICAERIVYDTTINININEEVK